MLAAIVITLLIPIVAGIALFFTDWAEATVVADARRPVSTE